MFVHVIDVHVVVVGGSAGYFRHVVVIPIYFMIRLLNGFAAPQLVVSGRYEL